MRVFLIIAYVVVGFIQLFAIAAGLESWLHINNVLGFVLAFVVTYIPLLGSGLGVYGAVTQWDWGLWQALILFFWYIPFSILMGIIGSRVGS